MANLQDNVGISGGSTLIGGTGNSENLTLKSTSGSTKGDILFGDSAFIEYGSDGYPNYVTAANRLVIGRQSVLAILSGANMFGGVVPKTEILTGDATEAYQELMVIRHQNHSYMPAQRTLGLLFKQSYETDNNESCKSGGMILESTLDYANTPELSLVTANQKRVRISSNGLVGININPATALTYQLEVNGTAKTGALTTTTITASGAISAASLSTSGNGSIGGTLAVTGAMTGSSITASGAVSAASLSTSGNAAVGGTLAATGLLSANGNIKVTVGSDTTGDMYYRGSGGNFSRVGIGSAGQVLTAGSGAPFWSDTQNVTPVGSYLFMATETAPDGYLRCDGSSLTRVEYPDLFDVIGTTYGNENVYTFNLPNTKGLFFRDLDGGRGLDPSRALSNSYQSDTFKEHNHSLPNPCEVGISDNADDRDVMVPGGSSVTGNAGIDNTETRPKNFAIVTFIKYGTYFNPF
jgi:microcystin-dependent protein